MPESSVLQDSGPARYGRPAGREAGFSLPELLVATTVLMVISGITTGALLQMTTSQQTIWNRTQMHAGVRSAFELLQQEIGQAGRVALPGPVALTLDAGAGSHSLTVSPGGTAGMFENELIVVGGANPETVKVVTIDGPDTLTVDSETGPTGFFFEHLAGAPISVYGAFASGIVPQATANGSTPAVLKLYGDIDGDGTVTYVEYTCDTVGGKLYRNSMSAWNTDPANKPGVTDSKVLLPLRPDPNGPACFDYQEIQDGNTSNVYVINVAVTLTTQTGQRDPITSEYQIETQTFNVSPRNVVKVWELASQAPAVLSRVQPMPPSITNLLP